MNTIILIMVIHPKVSRFKAVRHIVKALMKLVIKERGSVQPRVVMKHSSSILGMEERQTYAWTTALLSCQST